MSGMENDIHWSLVEDLKPRRPGDVARTVVVRVPIPTERQARKNKLAELLRRAPLTPGHSWVPGFERNPRGDRVIRSEKVERVGVEMMSSSERTTRVTWHGEFPELKIDGFNYDAWEELSAVTESVLNEHAKEYRFQGRSMFYATLRGVKSNGELRFFTVPAFEWRNRRIAFDVMNMIKYYLQSSTECTITCIYVRFVNPSLYGCSDAKGPRFDDNVLANMRVVSYSSKHNNCVFHCLFENGFVEPEFYPSTELSITRKRCNQIRTKLGMTPDSAFDVDQILQLVRLVGGEGKVLILGHGGIQLNECTFFEKGAEKPLVLVCIGAHCYKLNSEWTRCPVCSKPSLSSHNEKACKRRAAYLTRPTLGRIDPREPPDPVPCSAGTVSHLDFEAHQWTQEHVPFVFGIAFRIDYSYRLQLEEESNRKYNRKKGTPNPASGALDLLRTEMRTWCKPGIKKFKETGDGRYYLEANNGGGSDLGEHLSKALIALPSNIEYVNMYNGIKYDAFLMIGMLIKHGWRVSDICLVDNKLLRAKIWHHDRKASGFFRCDGSLTLIDICNVLGGRLEDNLRDYKCEYLKGETMYNGSSIYEQMRDWDDMEPGLQDHISRYLEYGDVLGLQNLFGNYADQLLSTYRFNLTDIWSAGQLSWKIQCEHNYRPTLEEKNARVKYYATLDAYERAEKTLEMECVVTAPAVKAENMVDSEEASSKLKKAAVVKDSDSDDSDIDTDPDEDRKKQGNKKKRRAFISQKELRHRLRNGHDSPAFREHEPKLRAALKEMEDTRTSIIMGSEEQDLFDRNSIYGGHTHVGVQIWTSSFVFADWNKASLSGSVTEEEFQNIKDYRILGDFKSMYASNMLDEFEIGSRFSTPKFVTLVGGLFVQVEPTKELVTGADYSPVFGEYLCHIVPNRRLTFAIMPRRDDDGRLWWDLRERTQHCHSVDIETMLKWGYQVSIINGYYWKKTRKVYEKSMLDGYAAKEDPAKSEGQRAMSKTCVCSTYGKCSQHPVFTKFQMVSTAEQLYDLSCTKKVHGWRSIGDQALVEVEELDSTERARCITKPAFHGAHILANTRRQFANLIEIGNPNNTEELIPYYCDTDSFLVKPEFWERLEHAGWIGNQLKQAANDLGSDAKVIAICAPQAKWYEMWYIAHASSKDVKKGFASRVGELFIGVKYASKGIKKADLINRGGDIFDVLRKTMVLPVPVPLPVDIDDVAFVENLLPENWVQSEIEECIFTHVHVNNEYARYFYIRQRSVPIAPVDGWSSKGIHLQANIAHAGLGAQESARLGDLAGKYRRILRGDGLVFDASQQFKRPSMMRDENPFAITIRRMLRVVNLEPTKYLHYLPSGIGVPHGYDPDWLPSAGSTQLPPGLSKVPRFSSLLSSATEAGASRWFSQMIEKSISKSTGDVLRKQIEAQNAECLWYTNISNAGKGNIASGMLQLHPGSIIISKDRSAQSGAKMFRIVPALEFCKSLADSRAQRNLRAETSLYWHWREHMPMKFVADLDGGPGKLLPKDSDEKLPDHVLVLAHERFRIYVESFVVSLKEALPTKQVEIAVNFCEGWKPSAHVTVMTGIYARDNRDWKPFAEELSEKMKPYESSVQEWCVSTYGKTQVEKWGKRRDPIFDLSLYNKAGSLRMHGMTKLAAGPPRFILEEPDARLSSQSVCEMFVRDRSRYDLLQCPLVVIDDGWCELPGTGFQDFPTRKRRRDDQDVGPDASNFVADDGDKLTIFQEVAKDVFEEKYGACASVKLIRNVLYGDASKTSAGRSCPFTLREHQSNNVYLKCTTDTARICCRDSGCSGMGLHITDAVKAKVVELAEQPKRKKAKISQELRTKVWEAHAGESLEAKCAVTRCERMLRRDTFHCGHNIAEANGGSTSFENLRVVCAECNQSMGMMSIDEYSAM